MLQNYTKSIKLSEARFAPGNCPVERINRIKFSPSIVAYM